MDASISGCDLALQPPRSAYVHVPFCRHRCGYCNFTVVAGRADLVEPYLGALETELRGLGDPRTVETLFLGGGTPSELPAAELDRLLHLVRRWFVPADGAEFTVEVNPETFDAARQRVLDAHGVNRISLGVQSLDDAKLARLERAHRRSDVRRACQLAGSLGADVACDLMFAAPGESLATWLADLRAVLDLQPQHVSTYGLTYERGTSFWSRRDRGQLRELDDDQQLAMYLAGIELLEGAGWEHYEISNFARPGHRCRHNQAYWEGRAWQAAGPGAARYVDGRRETNHRSTTTWIRRLAAGRSPVAESEWLSPEQRARERLIFGLRQLAGVDRASFAAETGYDLDQLVGQPLARHAAHGLLADDGRRVRLTRRGLVVSDGLWPDFL